MEWREERISHYEGGNAKKIGMTFLSWCVTICHTKTGALPPLPRKERIIRPPTGSAQDSPAGTCPTSRPESALHGSPGPA